MLDIIIVLLAIIALLRGAETGLVRQAASLAGFIAGVVVGSMIANAAQVSAVSSLIIVIIFIALFSGISEFAGSKLAQVITKIRLEAANHILGSMLGLAGCLVFVWLGSSLAAAIPSPQLQSSIRDSKIIAWLDNSLPPASNALAWLNDSLAQTKLPDIIKQLEPELPPPDTTATLPASSEFASVLAQHNQAVVEIEGRTCGGIGVGSGFIAKDNIVITNAHVVAGMRYPYVTDANGRHRAEVIGFNDDLDIAILRTGGLAGNPIPLATGTVEAGTQAIAVGYPGGGPQKVSPAVVLETFNANSRDIYGESITQRNLYTLKADIQQGNSGGPVLDKSGSVIAVIFAKSTTYNQVGYAITMPAVINELNAALQNPSTKDNLRCSVN